MAMFAKAHKLALLALVAAPTVAVIAVVGGVYWSRSERTHRLAQAMTGGEAARALAHFRRFGCAGCHTIPGVPSADGQVGGRLENLRARVYIGGAVLNSPENLIQWIIEPQTFAVHSAMPATGISQQEARDVAAYLYGR